MKVKSKLKNYRTFPPFLAEGVGRGKGSAIFNAPQLGPLLLHGSPLPSPFLYQKRGGGATLLLNGVSWPCILPHKQRSLSCEVFGFRLE